MLDHTARVLVTGGAGFIGSHVVEQLVARGAQVTVVDNLATGRQRHLAAVQDKIEWRQADLADLLRDGLCLHDFDYIFHLAANAYIPPSVEAPAYDFALNLHNTFTLLEALRQAPRRPRLVNVSSAAVYGNPASLPIGEGDPTVPISPYGVSKLAAERYVAVFSQLYGLPASSVRLFSVYGPRQRKQVVYDLLCRLRQNPRCLEVLGDGTQARDFAYVGDVARAILLVAERAPGAGEAINVATGTTYTIADLVEAWCRVLQLTPEVRYTRQVRPGDAEKWQVNISALSALGFQPQTPLVEGLQAVLAWYEAEHD